MNYAIKHDIIDTNVAYKAEKPKKQNFTSDILNIRELNELIEHSKTTQIYIPVQLAIQLGLRRSEALGLRWCDVDLHRNRIYIQHTVVQLWNVKERKEELLCTNNTKNSSSKRTLSISPNLARFLIDLKKKKKPKPTDYICQMKNGTIIKPNYLNKSFKKLVKQVTNKHIRFHDLRHSCATYLHEELGYDMKDIQAYLGHSNINTTIPIPNSNTKTVAVLTDKNKHYYSE